MIRKFYDIIMDCNGGNAVFVRETKNEEKEIFIECECGTHLLKVQSDADIYINSDESQQVHQFFYLAMFHYGNDKDGFWRRLRIGWNYLRSGKMFSDQIVMTPDEAKKLSGFINDSIISTIDAI